MYLSAERMTGNVVYVCADNNDHSCHECGRVEQRIYEKEWAEIKCAGGNGIYGTVVKVAATNSYLQIAEIKIYCHCEFFSDKGICYHG